MENKKIKVLCVIDVQNDFIDGSLRNEEAIKKVPNIVKKIKEFNGEVIFVTMDTHSKNYLETREGVNLPVEHCIEFSEGWKINPEVYAALEESPARVRFVPKPTFGSFMLAEEIDDFRIEENPEFNVADLDIEFVGFCTDICVVSNVLICKAKFFETADITVDASCCAGVTPESHNAALTTMEMCQVKVINKEQ